MPARVRPSYVVIVVSPRAISVHGAFLSRERAFELRRAVKRAQPGATATVHRLEGPSMGGILRTHEVSE